MTVHAILGAARQLRPFVPALLQLAGFVLISAAAFTVALPIGLAASGVSCLIVEALTREESP